MDGANVIEARGLGKRYGRRWALEGCTLDVPAGRVVGLVGPNGAGKTTLLHLAVGLATPSAGTIDVRGRVGFVAQDTPVYARLTVEDHLRMAAAMNATWDGALARERLARFDLDLRQKAGSLSGGQRAQLALTLAVGIRPDVLVLDEPASALDPLARRELLGSLMEVVASEGTSVVLSSHLVSDLERVADHLVVLVGSHVQLAGEVDELLAAHVRVTGPYRDPGRLPGSWEVLEASHTDRQSTLLVCTSEPVLDPSWTVLPVTLEDLVLASMRPAPANARALEAVR